ncbi:ABC transporter substrate-binding protein [Planctomyces sp. SH-PL62]|uniref:ABC transporter substrate-binding protein n=1 Tax=Planctomyces sp. SH-PL62 TaxID=1636152 RepID=UPI00078BC85C|nr:ABC transporter substrate-binding protein [Planctomyces sp. SH-PL62]AMV39290.1 extracellular solute-binding protein [Planctomyces sp. SH-PL62]
MKRTDRLPRILAVVASCCAVLLAASPPISSGQEAAPAPAAATADLLQSQPFDRITLLDGSVIFVEPVSPRPLPPVEMPKPEPRGRGGRPMLPLEGNIGLPGEPNKFQPAESRKDAPPGPETEITVHLTREAATGRGDTRDFKIKRNHIKKIEYFEEILLAEGERLLRARNYTRAFEHYLRVQQRDPDWPGLADQVDALLFAEGKQALADGDVSRGLRLLRELHTRKPEYPGLLDQFASAYSGRIQRAIELGLYPEGRRLLHELEQVAKDLPQTKALRSTFQDQARARASKTGAGSESERLDALVEALRIWPSMEDLEAEYIKAFEAEPTLDVAVVDVPHPVGPWVRSPADARVAPLLFLPILANDSEEAKRGQVGGQLAAELESTDLGRRLIVRVRPGVPWSDGSRDVSATDVARTLIDRCDPRNVGMYQARWSDLLEKVQPLDERQVEIRLNRPLLKPSFWLDAPVGAAHAGVDGRVVASPEGRRLVGTGSFVGFDSTPQSLDLRARPEGSGGSPSVKLRRIREIRHARPAAALAAFLRGDVAMLAHVPPDQRARLAATPDVRVGRSAQPVIHVLALDGRSEALRNRTLRRAISYAVDRKMLLEETILKGPPGEADAPVDGVFPRGSHADAAGVKPLGFDPVLALALASLARGEMKADAIKLKLEYPAVAEVEAVVGRLVEAFQLARIEVEAVPLPESQLESELRAGRRFDMAYRILRCDEPVLDAGLMICPGYDAPPSVDALGSAASPRILQLLLQLERAAEWPTANALALQIDRELRDELPVIPLWQLSDHYAWRSRLKGPSPTADRIYQGIETWEIAPWIAKDPWSSE